MQEAELPTEGLISIIDDDQDFREAIAGVCTENPIRVDDVTESPKLAE